MNIKPTLDIERRIGGLVCGVDEAGRGPLAGPVVAGAVIIPEGTPTALLDQINDSKKLSETKRETLFVEIQNHMVFGIGEASVEEIDDLNILWATMLAMERAVANLNQTPHHILIDGNRLPRNLSCPAEAVIKGDQKSLSIAAASIIAKTHRDRIMNQLANEYPHYGWDSNAGYGTAPHKQALLNHGITPHHRRSFAPIKNILAA